MPQNYRSLLENQLPNSNIESIISVQEEVNNPEIKRIVFIDENDGRIEVIASGNEVISFRKLGKGY